MKRILVLLNLIFQSFGVTLLFSPLFYIWLIHGSYERYIWIINGPKPFNGLGGGPNQFWLSLISVAIGIVFIYISRLITRYINNKVMN